jgi:uncharacterized membrane protein YhaH (DUF805 family)
VPFYKLAIKANHPYPFWALVPILDLIQMLQISRKSHWIILGLFIGLFIPFGSLIVTIYIFVKYFQAFGKSGWIALVMYLPFINIIYLWIIATDDNTQLWFVDDEDI